MLDSLVQRSNTEIGKKRKHIEEEYLKKLSC